MVNKEEIKSIEIPLDRERSKKISTAAINLMKDFFENKYTIELTESITDEIPILRITKENWHIIKNEL